MSEYSCPKCGDKIDTGFKLKNCLNCGAVLTGFQSRTSPHSSTDLHTEKAYLFAALAVLGVFIPGVVVVSALRCGGVVSLGLIALCFAVFVAVRNHFLRVK